MIEEEKIVKMPLNELLVYYNSLNAICISYESALKPLFNSITSDEQSKWVKLNNGLQKAKVYRDCVLLAMEEKCYKELDEYEPKMKKVKSSKTTPKPKKPIQTVNRVPK